MLSLVFCSLHALAADPGQSYSAASMVSDQKAGSVLVYNVYSSDASQAHRVNSRINLTNTSLSSSASVHLFFVDGETCSIADSFLCLTPNQTVTYLASDVDPGVTGYLIAIAVDSSGWPANFNYLIGDVFVKLASGHYGNIGAEAFAATFTIDNDVHDPSTGTATLWFDGSGRPHSYNPLPRVLAADNLSSRADDTSQYLVVNRIGGNLGIASAPVGTLLGLLFDDAEHAYSFSFNSPYCQLRGEMTGSFPRTVPRLDTVIPAGRSGWMRLTDYAASSGILGAMFECNPADNKVNSFNGGHNLHKLLFNLTNAGTDSAPRLVIPIFPPAC
jgi:hypothetical protein